MKIVVSLKNEKESPRMSFHSDTYYVRESDCMPPMNSSFFAEVGKFHSFLGTDAFAEALKRNEDIAFVQNKRCFCNLDSLHLDRDNDVILCKSLNIGSIELQYKSCHREGAFLFDEFVKRMNVPLEIRRLNKCCFHNMMIMKPVVAKEYLEQLIGMLVELYRMKPTETKYGALLSERVLYIWCLMNGKNIIEKDWQFT